MNTSSAYRESLQPWTVVAIQPDHRRVVASYRNRNDADAYRRLLQRQLPRNHYEVIFEPPQPRDSGEGDVPHPGSLH